MSNMFILLAVLGIINFLIKKFSSKPKVEPNLENTKPGSPQLQPASRTIDSPAVNLRSRIASTQTSLELAARKFADQARALGLVDEEGNYVSLRLSSAPVAVPPNPAKTLRIQQKPIGVTDFAPKPSSSGNSAGQSTGTPTVAIAPGNSSIPVTSALGQSTQRPISAIDSLLSSRLSQRIGPMAKTGQALKPKRMLNPQSLRQGVIMAEILSRPIALRA